MLNIYEYSSLECDCGILVNFNPVFSIIPPSGNGIAPTGATPNLPLEDTYILNFSVNSVSPSGSLVTLSPETYTINNSRIFIPTVTAKINSRYKVNSQALLKLVISNSYNEELYTDYTEILCLPDVIIRSGVSGQNSNDESGQIISVDSSDLEVGMIVTGTNIEGSVNITEIIDRRTIKTDGRTKSLSGTYNYKFTKSSCGTVVDGSDSYIYLNRNNNWSYTYNGQLIARFVPTNTNADVEVVLTAKNTRLPSKNSFYKIPDTSLFKLVGIANPGNSVICDNETCPSILGQLIYDGDSYSNGDEVTVNYEGFVISGSLKNLLTTLSESPYVTPTLTPSITPTKTPTPTVTRTVTPTPTVTRTVTPTPTVTRTVTPTPTVTSTVTPTVTVTPSSTPTPTVTPTETPTNTPTTTVTPTPTITVTPSRSASPAYYIYAWGDNTNGEYGTGNTTSATTPLLTDTNSSFVKFACGDNHTIAINSYGELYSWGSNSFGQLGDGTTNDTLTPIKIGTSNDWVDVQTSINNNFALNSAGKIYAWGNYYGPSPQIMLGTWKKMSVGGTSIAMISTDNKIYTFDYGSSLNSNIYQIQVGTNSNWSSISMGNGSLAAINSLGQLYLTSYIDWNGYGYSYSLIKYGSDTNWSSVVCLGGIPPGDGNANASMIFALKTTGEIYYYGSDYYAFYNYGFGYKNIMTRIGAANDWTQIFGVMNNGASSNGIFRLYAINSSNRLYGFGNTTNLGLGTGGFQSSLVNIGLPNLAWVTMNPGRQHALGIVSANFSVTPTPSVTPTISVTPTRTPTQTVTPTVTVTPTISITPTVTPTISLTPTVTPTISLTPTVTPTISLTPTVTPTISLTPTISITPTTTITATPTITVTRTVTPTVSLTRTPTPTSPPSAFVSIWNPGLTSTGSSNFLQVELPLISNGTYDFNVDWGDGTAIQRIQSFSDANKKHTYATSGNRTISITGTITGWEFRGGKDCKKITSIQSWGPLSFRVTTGTTSGNFYGCSNLSTLPNSGRPTLPIDCSSFFEGCSALFNANSVSNFDTTLVTNMSFMFSGCSNFDANLSSWNTGSVTNMASMFQDARSFNSHGFGLPWNVNNVNDMSYMFAGASSFNQPISSWNTSKVTTMNSMFYGALLFNQDLALLNISAITDMTSMLYLSGMSQTNYHNLLIGWGTGIGRTTRTNITFGIDKEFLSTNSTAVAGRSYLQSFLGWKIVDHGNEKTTIMTYDPRKSGAGATCTINHMLRFASGTPSENFVAGVVLDINWGDGTGQRISGSTPAISHNYSDPTTVKQIRIILVSTSNPGITYFQFGQDSTGVYPALITAARGITDIVRFGPYMRLVGSGFSQFENLNISATDQPLLPLNNILDSCFYDTDLSSATSLASWNTSGIISMARMFSSSNYDGDFRTWNFSSIVAGANPSIDGLSSFITNLSRINYDSLLVRLSTNAQNTNIYLGVGSTQYTAGGSAASARNTLKNTRGWTIIDGGFT